MESQKTTRGGMFTSCPALVCRSTASTTQKSVNACIELLIFDECDSHAQTSPESYEGFRRSTEFFERNRGFFARGFFFSTFDK
jgi:hypothetical protein